MLERALDTLRTALLDRYRVERVLGTGGMATVYLAHDLKHDRPVAIKVVRPELAAVLGRERFLREIAIAAKLTHPNILPLHDSGEAGHLLYYVMPYVTGETLLERVKREKQLPVDEALRITRQVATALEYAHQQGVVHRDIKPANILLSDGIPLIADFGLARAISRAKGEGGAQGTISHSGLTIGTPTYMSPEQAMGEEELDGRSDVYSLGCVLYELLAGDPPFTSSNPGAFFAKIAHARVIPIRTIRPSVPVWLERVLERALQKLPADRYRTAAEFAEALGTDGAGISVRGFPKWVTYGALVAGGLAVAIVVSESIINRPHVAALDTARIAVLPPVGLLAGDAVSRDLAQLLQDALRKWGGISVVDRFQVGDAMARQGDRSLQPATAAELARQLGAGRYFRSEAVRTGNSIRLTLGFFEVGRTAGLGEDTRTLRGDLAGADVVIGQLVDSLLLRGLRTGTPTAGVVGTTFLPAIQAYARGQASIQDWNLEAADSAFEQALGYDPEYPSAMLWLAQVRLWNNDPEVRWRPLAEKALAAKHRLGGGEELLVEGIAALASGDYPTACSAYRLATRRDPRRFVAWYGLATCVARDAAVIPGRTASGWRFRSSYEEAVKAYRQAFLVLPSLHVAFRTGGYRRIRNLLFTSGSGVKSGRALPPDTLAFAAYPGWQGDSLVFVPYPREQFTRGLPEARARQQEAVLHERERFHEIAVAWAGFYPNGADALEALALSVELLGDPSALDTLRRARRAARNTREALRVAATELWLRLKLALPGDLRGLQSVRALADSLLDRVDQPDAPDPAVLARIAALRGQAFLAANLGAQAAARGSLLVPRPLARDGPAFWTFAALGGPKDSLERLEKAVAEAIETLVLPGERAIARSDWLSRPASLAYPNVPLPSLQRLPTGSESLAHAQAAATRGEWDEVRHVIDAIRTRRRSVPPEDITFDRLYPEAHLLTLLGDTRGAADWLDPTLSALHRISPESLIDVPNVGGLVRGIALRAELADRLGDHETARHWAAALAILWEGADQFLEPIVRRMKQLAQ